MAKGLEIGVVTSSTEVLLTSGCRLLDSVCVHERVQMVFTETFWIDNN